MVLLTRHALAFIGLNLLRLLSTTSMLLVWVALLVMMIQDGNDFLNRDLRAQAVEDDCTYIPGTEIPTHAWGIFWAQLHRAFLLAALAIALVAEFGCGTTCDRIYAVCLPMLSRGWSVAPLGVAQLVIASSVLSHYMDDFPLVVSWLLFCVGLCNLSAGILFGSRMKGLRSIFASRRAAAREIDASDGDGEVMAIFRAAGKRKRSTGSTPFKSKAPAWKSRKHYGAIGGGSTRGRGLGGLRGLLSALASPLIPSSDQASRTHGTKSGKVSINEDFPSIETESQRELLRQRAREANARVEREQETRETTVLIDDTASETLSQAFVWDPRQQLFHERGGTSLSMRRRAKSDDPEPQPRETNLSTTTTTVPTATAEKNESDTAKGQVRIGGYHGSAMHRRAASRASGRTSSAMSSAAGSAGGYSSGADQHARRGTRKRHVVGGAASGGSAADRRTSVGMGTAALRAIQRRSAALAQSAKSRPAGSSTKRHGVSSFVEGDPVSIVVHAEAEGSGAGQPARILPPRPAYRPRYHEPSDDPVQMGHLPVATKFTRGWVDEI